MPEKKFSYKGFEIVIASRTPFPGIGWEIPRHKLQSGGAFYDDCDDHPEGAYAWAESAAKRFVDKLITDLYSEGD